MIKAKQAFFWTSDLEGFGFHGNKVTILHLTSSTPHVKCWKLRVGYQKLQIAWKIVFSWFSTLS